MINNNECKNCTPVLPLVFDESLSYYETLCKIYEIINYIFETKENNADTINDILNRIHTLEKTKVSKAELTMARLEIENKINEEITNLADVISDTYVNIIDYNRDKQTAKEYINTVVSTATENMNKESFFLWGGKDLENNLSPIDASMLNVTQANRFALMSPENILWERSSDGGNTWNIYNVNHQRKVDNVTTYNIISVVDDTNTNINNQLRVTFTFPSASLYMRLLKLVIDFGQNGANGCKCNIETSAYNSPEKFSKLKTVNLKGDRGWNVIQTSLTVGRQTETSQANHIHKIRLTFMCEGLTSGRTNRFYIRSIFGIAPTIYKSTTNLQYYGVPYTMYYTGRVDFESPIKAPHIYSTSDRAIADNVGNVIDTTYAKKTEIPIVTPPNITVNINNPTINASNNILRIPLNSYINTEWRYDIEVEEDSEAPLLILAQSINENGELIIEFDPNQTFNNIERIFYVHITNPNIVIKIGE